MIKPRFTVLVVFHDVFTFLSQPTPPVCGKRMLSHFVKAINLFLDYTFYIRKKRAAVNLLFSKALSICANIVNIAIIDSAE